MNLKLTIEPTDKGWRVHLKVEGCEEFSIDDTQYLNENSRRIDALDLAEEMMGQVWRNVL